MDVIFLVRIVPVITSLDLSVAFDLVAWWGITASVRPIVPPAGLWRYQPEVAVGKYRALSRTEVACCLPGQQRSF